MLNFEFRPAFAGSRMCGRFGIWKSEIGKRKRAGKGVGVGLTAGGGGLEWSDENGSRGE